MHARAPFSAGIYLLRHTLQTRSSLPDAADARDEMMDIHAVVLLRFIAIPLLQNLLGVGELEK